MSPVQKFLVGRKYAPLAPRFVGQFASRDRRHVLAECIVPWPPGVLTCFQEARNHANAHVVTPLYYPPLSACDTDRASAETELNRKWRARFLEYMMTLHPECWAAFVTGLSASDFPRQAEIFDGILEATKGPVSMIPCDVPDAPDSTVTLTLFGANEISLLGYTSPTCPDPVRLGPERVRTLLPSRIPERVYRVVPVQFREPRFGGMSQLRLLAIQAVERAARRLRSVLMGVASAAERRAVEMAFMSAFPSTPMSDMGLVLMALDGMVATLGVLQMVPVLTPEAAAGDLDRESGFTGRMPFASAETDGRVMTYFFPRFFDPPMTQTDQVSILVHESAHHTDDPGSRRGADSDIEDDLTNALNNAFNFQKFVNILAGLSVSASVVMNIDRSAAP